MKQVIIKQEKATIEEVQIPKVEPGISTNQSLLYLY